MKERNRALNVGIVGGGPGCKAIMDMIFARRLSELSMHLVGVACTNTQAQGYLYARDKGLYTTTDYRDLYGLDDLNMIIELTGRDGVAAEISRTKPDRIRLMDHVAARLFWDVFQIEEQRITERREAQAAIEAAEREKDAVLGSLVEHVVHQDTELKILWANRAACESSGLTVQDLVGRHCYEVWAGRKEPCPDCPVRKAMETGQTQEVEKWTPDGRAWYVRGHPMRNEQGVIDGAVELTLEITERKKAEKTLRESENKYRSLVEAMNEGLGVADENYVFTYVNEKFTDMLGHSKDEMIGHHLMEFVAPDYRDFMAKQMAHREQGAASRYELVWRAKDGGLVHTLISPRGIFDANGGFAGSIGVLTDITGLKTAEEALRESEAKYRNLFDMESDAIFLIENETGQILEANASAAALYEYSREELLQKKNTDLSAEPEDTRAATLERRSRIPIRYHEKKDGTVFPVEITARHFEWRGRDVHVAAIRDIAARVETEKKTQKLQSQLQQAQKLEAIGTLAGGIAHDFNNLLMGVQGNISLMLIDRNPEDRDYNRLKNMEKQVESGARLTSLLLGYARKGRYEVKPIDLNRLVEDACETFGRTRKEVTIRQDLDRDLQTIEADLGQIEQTLFNLLVNAADAMPNGGDLTVKTENTTHETMKERLYKPDPGRYVKLTVADTGTGMDETTMERIFDPFFTTKEMGHGTGLGLASAYGIIKAHGGYIDVTSKLGEGTTFSIYLPVSGKKVETPVVADARIVGGRETVLLVDDEESVREVGQELLETLGYSVILANHGKAALEIYEQVQDHVDIVLLDLVMPKMGGGEAFDRLKEIDPDVKVLLLSGYSIDGEAGEILERGCDGFIQKPFNMKDLSGKIREILDKK